LVVRGFTGYFLERADLLDPVVVPAVTAGAVSVDGFIVSIWGRLVVYVAAGILVSLIGVAFTSRMAKDRPFEEFPE
ncbi:MAG: hypothetical protein RI560_07000, partial [Natronomonas sp.]|nr:hypothetical protein [Natronomonas sp.]